ncbi:MAG: M56 family metallopeptidase, partial [Lachnospiraceae bacterium]|nr:M56 family metallopeptidase [Lachnospiraceae bacterium]
FYSELYFFPYLFVIWLVGFLGAFLSRIHKNRRLFLQLKATCPANTNRELELLKNQLAEKHHICRQVQIRHCALLNSPLISGIFHPTIFLPQTKLPEQYTEFILRHELTHCHRNDIFYKYLLLFIKSLYWFSPLIHIFSHIFNERCEIACDEALLDKYSRKEQLEYAKCIAGFAGYAQPDFTVSFYSAHTVEHRIASIAAMRSGGRVNRKKTVVLTGVAVFLLLTALMLTAANSTILRIALGKWMELLHTTRF